MTNKRARKKLQRAQPSLPYAPGGALMYVPPGVAQSTYGTTFYGSQMKNLPVGQTALFSPGMPLPTQQGVNPGGLPIQWKYMPAVNTFPPDRTQQQDDIPSFEQLRRLARLDYGINLCEQYWLDLVPRMTMTIVLRPEAVAQGMEEKDFQEDITYFKNFWAKPDGEHHWHEWMQMGLRENSQVDDVYLYKARKRGGQLTGLRFVAADQMKPLLDDWGYTPLSPKYAYQQYPWGIPGMLYTTDMMIHRRGTPAVDDPYGMSRVEKVILITNLALKKAKMDLQYYTDGNIPAGMMEVPEASNWTPDQIDSYEQSWNALMAGNLQQMRRIKFVQPGMKYTPFTQPAFDSVFDRYMLNIRASVYGVPMDELGFTDTSNRSVGESQEAMVYRRTIEPLASVYSTILNECMANDFEPSMHGDLLMVKFGGYEEEEDEQTKATTLSTYTSAGILGLSAAAKLAGLPEEPGAPQIGRMMMTQSGPVWLDDVAQPEMRKAQQQATLAGFQMATNPPEPAAPDNEKPPAPGQKASKEPPQDDKTMSRVVVALERAEEAMRLLRARNVTPEEEYDVTRTQEDSASASRVLGDSRRGDSEDARAGAQSGTGTIGTTGSDSKEIHLELKRWQKRAIDDVLADKTQRPFISKIIPIGMYVDLVSELERCECANDVRAVFERAKNRERDTSFLAEAASSNGGHPQPNKSAWKLRW